MVRRNTKNQNEEMTDDAQPDPAAAQSATNERGEEVDLSPAAAELVRQLQAERDQAVDGRLRALADFRNYQRRAGENEQRASQSAIARVVKSILPPLDHLDLALTQRIDQMTAEQLMQAVRGMRDEFNRALAQHGLERIEPATGDEFDPNRHEAVMRQASPGAAPNTVVATLQTGYALGDMVLRPAKVSVAMTDAQE